MGQAALSAKPYAASHGKVEAAWEAMRDYIAKKMKLTTVIPRTATIREKFREILADFRKRDITEVAGTGNKDEFDDFKRVWTEVSQDVKVWEEEDAKGAAVAEKKKRTREENARVGAQISDAIMKSRSDRGSVTGSAVSLKEQLQAELEAETESEAEAEELSQGKRAPDVVLRSTDALSFARARDKDERLITSSLARKRSKLNELSDLLQAEKDEREKELKLRQEQRAAELEFRKHQHEDEMDIRRRELEVRKAEAENGKLQIQLLQQLVMKQLSK